MTNLNQAIETATAKAAGTVWEKSVAKAARMLENGELVVTLFADNTALVTSPNGSYAVNGHCPCAARTAHCYHRAAKRIIELAETAPETKAELVDAIRAKLTDIEVADAVQSLCGPYTLEMLGAANLRHVLNAII